MKDQDKKPDSGEITPENKVKQIKKASLRTKLIWIVILSATLPILIFFLINVNLSFLNYRNILVNEQREKVNLGAQQISSFLEKVRDVLLTKTETPAFQEMDRTKVRYVLEKAIKRFKYFENLTLYDEEGKPLETVWFEEEKAEPESRDLDSIGYDRSVQTFSSDGITRLREGWMHIGGVSYKDRNLPLVDVAVPVISDEDGSLIGILGARVDLSHLWTIIRSLSGEKRQNAFLVDFEGNLLIHSQGRQPVGFDWKSIPPIQLVIDRIWESSTKQSEPYENSDGIKVLGMAAHIKGTQWGLIVEYPQRELFGGIYIFFWISFSISMIILLICILLAYRSFRSLLSPFNEFFHGVNAISEGELDYRIDINTGDEIEVLADGFNRMAESLEEQRKQRTIAHDELKKKKKELEITNRHLKEASRLRSEFIANMSHELRTPMNTIIGYTSIIMDGIYGEINEKQEGSLGKILQNAKSLSRLINDILDLSKLEAGKMPVFKERFLISQVIKESLQPFRNKIDEKNLELNIEIREDVELESDRSKIKQVMNHLIDNALKFTREGSIQLISEKSTNGEHIKISVVDTGIGITPDNLEKIFDEFRQLDGSYTREFGGTGMGLSIVRKLLKILDAKITVKSTHGEGSIFSVYLPIMPLEYKAPVSAPARKSESVLNEDATVELRLDSLGSGELTKKVILCVDDDQDFLEMMKDTVKGTDFRVVTASSYAEGIELARKIRPYLITTDIMMPDQPGWDLIKALKQEPSTLDIPIFVISIIDDREKAFSLGVTEYFIKPVDRPNFIERLNVLSRCKNRRILVIDDDQAFQESFFLIMREHGFQISTCPGGKEGLEKIRTDKPDVLILDLMMPEISGYDILEAMKEEGLDREIPVILMTAKDLTQDELNNLKTRVFSIFRKMGITRKELVPRMRSVFERIWCSNEASGEWKKPNL